MAGGHGKQRRLGLPDLTGRAPPKAARPQAPVPGEGGEWYAVSDDGDSALRIRPGLRIGETETGALVFNDTRPERQWIALQITPEGACRVEVVGDRHRLVDEGGNTVTRHDLTPGMTLAFPGNTLCISDHIAAPARPGPRLAVVADRGPAVPAVPANRWKVAAGLAAGGLAAAALLIWLAAQDAVENPVTAPVTPPVELVEIPRLAPRTVAVPLEPIDLDGLPARRLLALPDATPAVGGPRAADMEAFTEELARARELLDAGHITYPPDDNAVALLTRIMEREPGHAQALALLGECTTRLIDAAVEAREQGLDYQARNLLEEVRGFNPDNERANRLWQEWIP